MTTQNKHTPLPFIANGSEILFSHPTAGRDYQIAQVYSGLKGGDTDEAQVNAEFITRACNSHYDLLWLAERARTIRQHAVNWTKAEILKSWEHWDSEYAKVLARPTGKEGM